MSARARRQTRHPYRERTGVILLAAFLGLLLLLPALARRDPYRIALDALLLPPSLAHPLGTDENGRDVLARLLQGGRATLAIGLGGAAIAVCLGATLGAVAGYRGGALDALLMRFVDFALALPSLFAILLFTALVRAGVAQLIILIGITGWMGVARLTRGTIRELLNAAYIEAARVNGATGARIIARHLLPNTGAILFVAALVQLSRAILTEATISFLGLGIQPPEPTWGNLLIGAQDYLYSASWLAIAPGLAITATLLLIYIAGMGYAAGPQGHGRQ
jgi:peptide/nickel transport system permease protein